MRMISVFFWLLLTICTFHSWKYLASSLKPEAQPIWLSYDGSSLILGSWYLFAVVSLTLSILYIYELKNYKPEILSNIIIWVALLGLAAVFAYPIGSTDHFAYAAYARLHAYYGLNPYVDTVSNISDYLSDPFLRNMWWVKVGSVYGPIWTWISYIIYNLLSKFGLIALIIGYKMFGLLIHILITVVVYKLSEVVANGRESQAALLYGMNPLAIFELVVNAHNDGLAILIFLISILLLIQKKYFKGFIIVGMSAACKLTVGIGIIFMIWKTAKEKGLWYARLSTIMAILLVTVTYLPFLDGSLKGLLGSLNNPLQGFISNSISTLPYALGLYQLILPVRIMGLLIFAFLFIILLRKSQDANKETLIIMIGLGFVIYYLFGAYTVLRWYFLWPLALMAVVPESLWTKSIIGQSVLMLISYTLYFIFGEGEATNAFTYLLIWAPLIYIWGLRKTLNRNIPLSMKEIIKSEKE